MRKNSGFTITEMLVSLAIIAILLACLVLVITGITNLNKKVSCKENAIEKVEYVLNRFESDHTLYSSDSIIYIYYGQKFIEVSATETTNYLQIEYSDTDNLYILKVTVYISSKEMSYGDGSLPFTREVLK